MDGNCYGQNTKTKRFAGIIEEERVCTIRYKMCIRDRIKIDTLFKVDGFKMWLSGRTGNQLIFKGANQLILSHQEAAILKGVVKYVNRKNENKDAKLSERDGMTEEKLLQLYDTFLDKLSNTVYSIRLSAQIKTLTGGAYATEY